MGPLLGERRMECPDFPNAEEMENEYVDIVCMACEQRGMEERVNESVDGDSDENWEGYVDGVGRYLKYLIGGWGI